MVAGNILGVAIWQDTQDSSEVQDPFERNEQIHTRNSGGPVDSALEAVDEQELKLKVSRWSTGVRIGE